jgi:L-ascorbate oxidase
MAIVDVDPAAGKATSTEMPDEATVGALAPPTTWMGMVDGKMQEVSCDSVKTIHQKVALLVPTPGDKVPMEQAATPGACVPDPDHDHPTIDPNLPVCVCPEPNINCRRFDERRALGYRSDRVMTVDTSERWQIVAFDGHPFHIHINPFLVCPNHSNKGPNFAHWRDTYWVQAEDGPQAVMMNFRKFTGQFVIHCHKLNHEDEGMMELTEICAAGDEACLCQGKDMNGQCISQAGCKADDKRCQFAKAAADAAPLPPPPDPALCGP